MPASWDSVYLAMATAVSQRSKDPNTRVGAVLVSPNHRKFAVGYNGFPPGVNDDPSVLSRKSSLANRWSKDDLVMHAEENVLINCSERPDMWTLYVTHVPCVRCARSILAAGIARVVTKGLLTTTEEHHRGQDAIDLLRMHGVQVDVIKGATCHVG